MALMMRVIQMRDGSDKWSNHIEQSLIVAMYEAFLCLPAQHWKVFW